MISADIFTGIALTKELRFRSLCDYMVNIFRLHIGEGSEFDELVKIIKRAEEFKVQRNRFAHAPLHSHEQATDEARLWKITAKRKGIKYITDSVSDDDLESLANGMDNLQNEMLD